MIRSLHRLETFSLIYRAASVIPDFVTTRGNELLDQIPFFIRTSPTCPMVLHNLRNVKFKITVHSPCITISLSSLYCERL